MAKKKEKPIILITNDDDITSKGIRSLVEAVKDLGTVVVVAPDRPQSGMGHAITIGSPLRMNRMNLFGEVEAWQTSGTPVDCVKLAVDKILHRKPDLCLSGINHGANHSINVIYSGTMSAAMVGTSGNTLTFSLASIGNIFCGKAKDFSSTRVAPSMTHINNWYRP